MRSTIFGTLGVANTSRRFVLGETHPTHEEPLTDVQTIHGELAADGGLGHHKLALNVGTGEVDVYKRDLAHIKLALNVGTGEVDLIRKRSALAHEKPLTDVQAIHGEL